MKKSVWFLVKKVLIVIMTIVIIAIIYFGLGIVNMNSMQEAEAVFIYEKNNVRQKMSDKELEILKTLFDGKIMYRDNPSCGFSEDVSVIFDREQAFCIACDNCPIVYWKNKNRYITLSEDEKNQLRDLLEPYGFCFPCL